MQVKLKVIPVLQIAREIVDKREAVDKESLHMTQMPMEPIP